MKQAFLYFLLIGISCCSNFPMVETPGNDRSASVDMGIPTESAGTGVSSNGVTTASSELLKQSRASQALGDYEQAASNIERALRIEPGDPYLWLELGKIRLATGNKQQATALAQKAMSMASYDANARREAKRLLDEATAF